MQATIDIDEEANGQLSKKLPMQMKQKISTYYESINYAVWFFLIHCKDWQNFNLPCRDSTIEIYSLAKEWKSGVVQNIWKW